jgi:hypothetical protein
MARPKRRIRITGEVVPPGSLRNNRHNPYCKMLPTERWEGVVRACAVIVEHCIRDQIKEDGGRIDSPEALSKGVDMVPG